MNTTTAIADTDREELTRLVRLGIAYYEDCVLNSPRESLEYPASYYRRCHTAILAKVEQAPVVSRATLGGRAAELFESVVSEGISEIQTYPEKYDLPPGATKIHARLAKLAQEISYG